MNRSKRETVEEIARHPGSAYVVRQAEDALAGKISLDRALTETSKHARTFYAKNIADKAIDKD